MPVAITGAASACSAERNCATIPSSMAEVPCTMPLCRQSAVFVPSRRRGLASNSTWGSWAVFLTSDASEHCGPGRMAPPTRAPVSSTARTFTRSMPLRMWDSFGSEAIMAETQAGSPGMSWLMGFISRRSS